jgi:hypothetical protein
MVKRVDFEAKGTVFEVGLTIFSNVEQSSLPIAPVFDFPRLYEDFRMSSQTPIVRTRFYTVLVLTKHQIWILSEYRPIN